MQRVTADELKTAIDEAFSVWSDPRAERNWARAMWEHLTVAGFADYGNDLERHVVLARFLVLAGLYLQFWDILADESWDPEESQNWLESVETSVFRVGQLVGRDTDLDDEYAEDSQLQAAGWVKLANGARPDVVQALTDRLGGWENLYESLFWSSTDRSAAPAVTDDAEEIEEGPSPEPDPWDASVGSDDQSRRARALAAMWVMDGCQLDPPCG